jgi:hypothetical protein
MDGAESPKPSVPAWAIPTRPAAIALLLLDVALLAGRLLFIHWEAWFVWAYIPLLFTVAWGFWLGGIWLKVPAIVLFLTQTFLVASFFILSATSGGKLDRIHDVLMVAEFVLTCLGVLMTLLAARGWYLFFAGRLAS